MRWCINLSFIFLIFSAVQGQKPAIQDSLDVRIKLLNELAKSGNFERAQIEVEDFRWFVRRERVLIPAKSVPIISNIYKANKDERSALKFLQDVELDVQRERDVERKAIFLHTLIKEYENWELPEKALACQRKLAIAQDSLASRKVTAETIKWRKQLDSLESVRKAELSARGDVVEIERNRAYTLAAVAALIFLALLAANFMTADRWRKRLENKQMETDLLMSNRSQDPIPPTQNEQPNEPNISEIVPVAQQIVEMQQPEQRKPYSHLEENRKTALIIEPNRQIALYLKSLLSDTFEIETASTANEGLQIANDILPDLVVCDAVLNGKTGIDVVRQIKFSERTSHIPVILLTEHNGNEANLDALRCGAETWFLRPLLDKEMDEQVKKLLGIRKIKQDQFARSLHLYFSENRVMPDNPFLKSTLQFIETYLSNPDFTAEDLSRKMQMSRQLYHKKLEVLSGKEPTQLIREMRLEKARDLLEKRAAPVQVIAELVGFTNPGTFSRAYKEYFGDNTLLLNATKHLSSGDGR